MAINLVGGGPVDPDTPFTFQIPPNLETSGLHWPPMAEIADLRREVEDNKKEIKQLTANFHELLEKHQSLTETLKVTNRENVEAKAALKELQQQYDEGISLTKKSYLAKKQLAEAKIAALQIDVDQLKEENQAATLSNNELAAKLRNLEEKEKEDVIDSKRFVQENISIIAENSMLKELNEKLLQHKILYERNHEKLLEEHKELLEKHEELREKSNALHEGQDNITYVDKPSFRYQSVSVQTDIHSQSGESAVRCDISSTFLETQSVGTQSDPVNSLTPEVRVVVIPERCTHTYVKDAALYFIILLLSIFSLYTWNLVWRSQPGAFGFGGPAVDNTITRFHARVAQYLLDKSGGSFRVYM